MTLNRRQFGIIAGTGIAAAVASSKARIIGPQGAEASSTPGGIAFSQFFRADEPVLHIEVGGLAAFEWWKSEKRMAVHFPTGRESSQPHPHRVILTADMRTVQSYSVPPVAVSVLPGGDELYGMWDVGGYELTVAGARTGDLTVEDQVPETPCPSKPDDPSSWRTIYWLPDFRQAFGALQTRGLAPSSPVGARLLLTSGRVQCLMPVDPGLRRAIFRFEDENKKVIPGLCRALSDRVLYEFRRTSEKPLVTLVGSPLPGNSKPSVEFVFKPFDPPPDLTMVPVPVAIPVAVMGLPEDGLRSPDHFVMYKPLTSDAERDAKPIFDRLCSQGAGGCGPTRSQDLRTEPDGDVRKVPGDLRHCFNPLMVHE